MDNEVPNEVKTQIGTFIFNEYGNPDIKCTASQWLRQHNFIINSVTKSNIVFHEGYYYFNTRGAILVNNSVQKSDHGKLSFDQITYTVNKNSEVGQWLVKNQIDPDQITINNFKFSYKSDQWLFIDPSQKKDSSILESNQQQDKTQINNEKTPNTTYDYQSQKQKLNDQIQKRKQIKKLQELLNQQQMQYIQQMRQTLQMQHEFQLNQIEQMKQMLYPSQINDNESSGTLEYDYYDDM